MARALGLASNGLPSAVPARPPDQAECSPVELWPKFPDLSTVRRPRDTSRSVIQGEPTASMDSTRRLRPNGARPCGLGSAPFAERPDL